MSSPSFTVLFPEALRTHKQEYFQTEVSSTQLVGVQSLGPEQRLHEVMPEKQTGLAWAGTLAGVLPSGSAPPRTRWFASEGSCWCWQGWEVAPQPSTPCTGQRPWVRRLPRCMQPVLGVPREAQRRRGHVLGAWPVIKGVMAGGWLGCWRGAGLSLS